MTLEMRKKLAAESWEEKIRKVGMLNDMIKRAPKLGKGAQAKHALDLAFEITRQIRQQK